METITAEHPEFTARKSTYRAYRDLYVGGEQIKHHAAEYLTRRQKEPLDVYHERLTRVFYENYIGSIIDWYAATLFRREPQINAEGEDQNARQFFARFSEDCDRAGTTITDFFREQFTNALIFGSSYTLVDFPRTHVRAKSRAEEDEYGQSRAYVVGYTPEHLINWSRDGNGWLEWVVLRSTRLKKTSIGVDDWKEETSWVYYGREEYRIYQSDKERGESGPVRLVDGGAHALASVGLVPLFETRVPAGLWLMNKAASLQLEHFNKSNALAWAVTMGLFATPVVYTDRQWDQIVGESYFIQLSPEDRFGWAEPEGKVYQIAAENLTRLQEEIYRTSYLLNQGGAVSSSLAQSGLSKLRDFAITQEVLKAYGDALKDSMKRVLRAIAVARGDEVAIDVSGFDEFDIADFRSDLEDAERLLKLGIESPTLRNQIFKRLAHKYLCDVRQEVKDRIAAEIEAQS